MSVATRKFSASPKRAAAETWSVIVNAIAPSDTLKTELNAVTGVAALVIAERTPTEFPITIIGSGPRLRIYCLYDEDAVMGEDEHEDPLSWSLFEAADWKVHFPAEAADLETIEKALQEKGGHFAVYKTGEVIKGEEEKISPMPQMTIDTERFNKHV